MRQLSRDNFICSREQGKIFSFYVAKTFEKIWRVNSYVRNKNCDIFKIVCLDGSMQNVTTEVFKTLIPSPQSANDYVLYTGSKQNYLTLNN